MTKKYPQLSNGKVGLILLVFWVAILVSLGYMIHQQQTHGCFTAPSGVCYPLFANFQFYEGLVALVGVFAGTIAFIYKIRKK